MKILYLDWGSYCQSEQIEAFKKLGHSVVMFPFDKHTNRVNKELDESLTDSINIENPDFVFSFNYFIQVSNTCNKLDVKYVSWVFDSPYVQLYSKSVINPCNYIFVFDKNFYYEFNSNKINTVYYLPLASDPIKLSTHNNFDLFKRTTAYNHTDIAFVGSLYTEDHQFFCRMTNISDYTKGYLEAIMTSQMNVYGENFIEQLLTPQLLDDMCNSLHLYPDPDGVETMQYLYAQYVINRRITGIERTRLLNLIGTKHKYDLYTIDKKIKFPNCINHGKADPSTVAPYIYKTAKINLNITLRSITSGIPLRAFEIMGSGGFLLSNYQRDFSDCYVENQDYVYFDSPDDMMNKIEYYLSHEKERLEIARNGYEKTLHKHTFAHRIKQIIEIVSN